MRRQNKLQIGQMHSCFIGSLELADWHEHGALVLLSGLSGPIRIKWEEEVVECQSALIDANVRHVMDCQGETFCANYFEVDSVEAKLLRAHFLKTKPVYLDLVSPQVRRKRAEASLFNANLNLIIDSQLANKYDNLDHRILDSIDHMKNQIGHDIGYQDLADRIELSPSRFRHLFKNETGLPYSRYRTWRRIAHFAQGFRTSKGFTRPALEAGFYDSAHMGNAFKKMLGLSPSQIFNGLSSFEIK